MSSIPPVGQSWEAPDPAQQGDPEGEALYLNVGIALTAWASVEMGFAIVFTTFVGTRVLGAERIFGTISGIRGKVDALTEASRAAFYSRSVDEETRNEWKLLLGHYQQASARRNEIAHGTVTQLALNGKQHGSFLIALYHAKKAHPLWLGSGAIDELELLSGLYRYTSGDLEHFRGQVLGAWFMGYGFPKRVLSEVPTPVVGHQRSNIRATCSAVMRPCSCPTSMTSATKSPASAIISGVISPLTMLERLSILIPMYRLTTEQRVSVLSALVEGASIRATVRMTGVAKNTVVHLLEDVGAACLEYQRKALVNLPCKRIQCDEIWSFIGMKQSHASPAKRAKGMGDIWTWTAICADTKLVPAFFVGDRTGGSARIFLKDLEMRLASRVQLTTDAHRPYLFAVEDAFGWNGVDYAMLDKIYGASPEGERRYSPAVCIGTEVRQVMGNPDTKHISTSYVERSNLTMRMGMRRFTRLTNAFSKKVENHKHAVALHFMHYNFCRPHQTLTKANKGVLKTPAMAAGVTDHVWKIEEIVMLIASL